MPKLSQYFTLEELISSQTAARRGIDNLPDSRTLIALQHTAQQMDKVRTLLGKPVHVSSGYRSLALNAAIGGSKTSSHLTGEAVDFTCPAYGSLALVFGAIENSGIKFDQLILEFGQWIHIGFGQKMRGQCLIYDGKTYREVG